MAELIEGTREFRRNVERFGEQIIADLAQVTLAQADRALSVAQANVPRGSGDLAKTTFVDGPAYSEKTSAYSTCGYESEHAGAVHEGFHYGRQTEAPPKWLEHAVESRKQPLIDAMRTAAEQALSRLK